MWGPVRVLERRGRRVACAAAALVLWACMALIWPGEAVAASIEDGVYEVDIAAYQATKDQASMCHGALENPAQLEVSNGTAQLRFALQPVAMSGLNGYLGIVRYFPGWAGSGLPDKGDAEPARVTATYKETDSFNNKKGSDALMKGVSYPKEVELDWDASLEECYLLVYVPVMNAISEGNGWQYVRLRADYGSLKRVDESDEDGGSGQGGESGGQGDGTGESGSDSGSEESGADKPDSGSSDAGDSDSGKSSSSASGTGKSSSSASGTGSSSSSGASTGKSSSSTSGKGGSSDGGSGTGKTGSGKSTDSDETSKGEGSASSSSSSSSSSASQKSSEKLDFKNLPDGTYEVSVALLKTDRETPSMANAALNPVAELTVKSGVYRLVLKLGQVTFAGQSGYLGALSYFKTGYATDEFGAPTGAVSKGTVLSYQMEGGKKISDSLGTDYPAEVEIVLIPEAKRDGFAPLQAYVPIMESIAAGTGTQSMYLKLDAASVARKGEGAGVGESGSGPDANGANGGAAGNGDAGSSAGGADGSNSSAHEAGGSTDGLIVAGNTLPSAGGASSGGAAAALPSATTGSSSTLPSSTLPSAGSPASSKSSSSASASKSSSTSLKQAGSVSSSSSSSASVNAARVTEVKPVGDSSTGAAQAGASEQSGPEPPLKNAVLPAGLAGGAVVALGVGSTLFRRREWLFDEVQ